uniref:Gypsy retrotransposon integrase-like protein 1 n=1 Tax=Oryzias latipes TaxID=8090 RepID=A0A3B3HSJ7_ORYLA
MFDLQDFLDHPSHLKVDLCRKDDLLLIAAHFGISVSKQSLKREIKNHVVGKLIQIGVLGEPMAAGHAVLGEAVSPGVSVSDVKDHITPIRPPEGVPAMPVTLPRFDESSPHVSGSGAKLKVRLTRLHLEAEEKERVRKAEYDLRLQVKKLEIEAEKEIRLRQIELEAMKISSGQFQPSLSEKSGDVVTKHSFDVSRNIALVPAFRESEVDSYFNAFERVASALDWPKDMWPILLHCKLVGKAQEVVSALSLQESLDYSVLKEAILRAYELVPEAYRQRYRNHKKSSEQTFVEFAREKGNLFDKWCASSNVKDDFEALRQLVLLEDFKRALPEKLVVFLNEQKVSSLSKAAVLADEFVLTHKNVFGALHSQSHSDPLLTRLSHSDKPKPPLSPPRSCFYCHKRGHLIADCYALKKSTSSSQPKGMGLMQATCSDLPRQQEGINMDPCFKPFVSTGVVSLTDDTAVQCPVKILRDTGGSQSIVRDGVLPLTEASSCGSFVMIQGIGANLVSAPLHTIYLKSSLVTGMVKVAVLSALPIDGVDLILGNDLAGGKVTPVPELLDSPSMDDVPDKLMDDVLFPSCVVTRARSKKGEIDLSDSFLATDESSDGEERTKEVKQVVPPLTSIADPNPASRKDFIMAQRNDVTLSRCLSSVVLKEEARRKTTAYFLDNNLLMRRWSDGLETGGRDVYQVVVPTDYRNKVLSLAHDHPWSGHLGVNKTYNRILRHFFWPGLKADVVRFCKTCHKCQVAGKPNQVIRPAPLHPIPAIGEPFGRVTIDCVGPLPKTKMGNQFLLTIMCAATRFPEAIPLRKITAPVITKALVKFFTVFGLPTEIQSDQGTNFKSRTFARALSVLGSNT